MGRRMWDKPKEKDIKSAKYKKLLEGRLTFSADIRAMLVEASLDVYVDHISDMHIVEPLQDVHSPLEEE